VTGYFVEAGSRPALRADDEVVVACLPRCLRPRDFCREGPLLLFVRGDVEREVAMISALTSLLQQRCRSGPRLLPRRAWSTVCGCGPWLAKLRAPPAKPHSTRLPRMARMNSILWCDILKSEWLHSLRRVLLLKIEEARWGSDYEDEIAALRRGWSCHSAQHPTAWGFHEL